MEWRLRPKVDSDREFLYALHQTTMRQAIESTWGWDEGWQRADFERRLGVCSVSIIEVQARAVGGLWLGAPHAPIGPDEDLLGRTPNLKPHVVEATDVPPVGLDPAGRDGHVADRLPRSALSPPFKVHDRRLAQGQFARASRLNGRHPRLPATMGVA